MSAVVKSIQQLNRAAKETRPTSALFYIASTWINTRK
jgi:hypothetical protein